MLRKDVSEGNKEDQELGWRPFVLHSNKGSGFILPSPLNLCEAEFKSNGLMNVWWKKFQDSKEVRLGQDRCARCLI